MNSKPFATIFIVIASLVLLSVACSAGFLAGRTSTVTSLPPTGVNIFQNQESTDSPVEEGTPTVTEDDWQPKNREELFEPFWDAWDIVHQVYIDQPVDDVALMRGAISGMMEALGDRHSSYMDPHVHQQLNAELEGEYEGIGAWMNITGEYLEVISAMPNTPAEEAGLRAGDQVIAVDGEDMTGVDPNLVIRNVLGPAGTDVTLTVAREGESEPLDFTITRAKITLASVDSRMLENDIAYIQLIQFGAKTRSELRDALEELMEQNPSGLILDLRNNGGGYLDTAIEVGSEFLEDGEVLLYEEYADGSRDVHESEGGGLALDIPMVVLVNEGSASAAEIIAGAVQDLDRGQLVGVTTYGKGSVQSVIPLENEQGVVRVTIARWLTPDSRQIDEVGLEPDIVVELTEEDLEAERDPQLDKAIEILTTEE